MTARSPWMRAAREQRGPDADRWKIAVPRIPLAEGPNTIVLSARNDDGWALLPGKLAVTVTAPPPPKAEVVFLSPLEDCRTDDDRWKVRMHVKSASRIQGLRSAAGAGSCGGPTWRSKSNIRPASSRSRRTPTCRCSAA